MELYNYKAELLRVIDADTIEVIMDLGFKTYQRRTVRLLGFDAAETRTKDLEEKALGMNQMFWMESLLRTCKFLVINTKKKDSFGRYLGDIYTDNGDFINEMFVEKWPETKV